MNEQMLELDGAFQDLVQSLALEVDLFKKLDLLLKEKQSSIIKGDVDTLQNIVHEEQRLIPKMHTATQSREHCAATIAAVSKLKVKKPSLMELINLAPSHHSQKLIQFREQLILNLDRIAHVNRENEFLLNSSVELVRGLVQVLLGTNEDENTYYGGRGKISEDRTRKSHVDCQG